MNVEIKFHLECSSVFPLKPLGFLYSTKVLAESEQMRKEADDVGPKAELEHWKKRMAKFNSLLDQIKGADCKAVVGVLHAAKSKLLKVQWRPPAPQGSLG